METSRPDSAFPLWTDWAAWAKARMPRTNRFMISELPRRAALLAELIEARVEILEDRPCSGLKSHFFDSCSPRSLDFPYGLLAYLFNVFA